MEFPPEIVRIISEFSKPRTHPNWRKIKNMCINDFYNEIKWTEHSLKKVFLPFRTKFIERIKTNPILRKHIHEYGFKSCSQQHGIKLDILLWTFNN
jgi:hypothetical protein